MGTFENRKTKYIPVVFFIILFLAVEGVLFAVFLYKNDKGGNILVGASPDTSAFQLYYYDGETVMVRTLYDSSTEKEVIKRINDIPLQAAEEQALSQMETPFFGIWISSGEGYDISVTASGGVWLRNDGAVYYGDTDLSFLWREMEGSDEDTWNVLNFPNAGHLSVYHSCFLLKADELPAEGTEGVSMNIEDIGTSEITVLIANNSGEEFTYGEYFSLQKQIDGQWYTMPVRADNVGFQDIAHILPDGESASETYNLDIYGTLEPGMYRLVVETLSAEFLMGHGRMAGTEGEEK